MRIINNENINIMNNAGVYSIININNNKRYIGSTKNFSNRLYHHENMLKNKNHHSLHLQKSWNKYGESSFVFDILEICNNIDSDYLKQREQVYLNQYKSYERNNGYNICSNAKTTKGYKFSKDSLEKLINIRKGKGIKLNNDLVKEIINLLLEHVPIQDICNKYNISYDMVIKIKRRDIWDHILPEITFNDLNYKIGAVLTEDDVKEIKLRILKGDKDEIIAINFNVSKYTINCIRRGRLWKDIYINDAFEVYVKELIEKNKIKRNNMKVNNRLLTKEEIYNIKMCIINKIKYNKIVEMFNISNSVFYKIKRGEIGSDIKLGKEFDEMFISLIKKRKEKFSNEQIVDIKNRIVSGETLISISKYYKCSSDIIGSIKDGETYKYIKIDDEHKLKDIKYRSKNLTNKDIINIKLRLVNKDSIANIAQDYNVRNTTIENIKYGITYKNISIGEELDNKLKETIKPKPYKLSVDEVKLIKQKILEGYKNKYISDVIFNHKISYDVVYNIRTNKTFSNITL